MDIQTRRKVNNIILNENAYFYENSEAIVLSRTRINELFRKIATTSGRIGRNLLVVINEPFRYKNKEVNVSICVFKYDTKPRFIVNQEQDWFETKLAYIVIVDFESYIVITRKNIAGYKEFVDQFISLDYSLLSTLFVNDETSFEKFVMKNMNISDKAIREKSLEANDLRENFSPLGANNYILNNIRLSNNNEKISLSLNTGRINKFGKKKDIQSFIDFSGTLIEQIVNHEPHDTFLSIFAEPLDYEAEHQNLSPIAVLFLFSKLFEDLDNNRIQDCKFVYNGIEKSFSITKYLNKFERLCQIDTVTVGDETKYFVKNTVADDLEAKLNAKSITFRSEKLSKMFLILDTGYKESIIEYMNRSNQFIMNFDNVDLIYTNRKLFRDTKLLSNIEFFMNVFKPYSALSRVTSEKGNFTVDQTSFDSNSIFGFVESEFLGQSDYFLCDDLGKEWTDHISINSDKISFYLSKFDDSLYSASAFQDIIGQAQKNLGNISPVDYQIDSKLEFWQKNYKSNLKANNVQTQIPRLRFGNSVQDAINQFKKTKLEPNLKREMYLIINFISKSGLNEKLEQLKNAEAFAERNEVIQILWFISSLISSCREVGVDVYICCKE